MFRAKHSEQLLSFEKQALKTKNYIFSRTHSMKLERPINKLSQQRQDETKDENLFVPKLKSKQLLREPKFFFSLERKKIKNEKSQPQFHDIRVQNPEMKGSKAKSLYTKMLLTRKQSIKACLKVEKGGFSRSKSFNERSSTSQSQCQKVTEVFANEKIRVKLESCFPNQTTLGVKEMKRPNLYENISFLIRRKRQIKNRSTMLRINQSKHYMSEGMRNPQEETK